jgi:hypothetical protein
MGTNLHVKKPEPKLDHSFTLKKNLPRTIPNTKKCFGTGTRGSL